jgi:hypothetical protein
VHLMQELGTSRLHKEHGAASVRCLPVHMRSACCSAVDPMQLYKVCSGNKTMACDDLKVPVSITMAHDPEW